MFSAHRFYHPNNHLRFGTPDLRSLPGPEDITRHELPNGLIILSRSNFNSPSVVVSGYLRTGSLFDPDEKLGLADFTAAVLMRGTAQHTFQQIYGTLEAVGASLSIGGGTHSTGFFGKALIEDLDTVLSLLAEAIRWPVFPVEYVERLRSQLLASLAVRAQDTAEMASLAFDKLVYRDHPYSRPQEGDPETVTAIQVDDLIAFHQRTYGPRGGVIAVVGAIEPLQAVEKVTAFLGDWENPDQMELPPLPGLDPLESSMTTNVIIPGRYQSDIIMGAAGPPRSNPEYLAAALGNNILGQLGMMGRIGASVREKAGLAYYASSSLSGGIGPAPWYISAGIAPENTVEAIELILHEVRTFVSELVSLEELEDTQAEFIGRLPISMESNAGVAHALTHLERYQLGLDYYRRYPALVQAVTAEEILHTARCYLDPGRMGIAIAGP